MQPSKESQEWVMGFYSDEQKQTLAARNYTPEDAARDAERWATLIADVNAMVEKDPASPEAQALADRWTGLIGEFTQGRADMGQSLGAMYSNVENLQNPAPQDFQAMWTGMKPASEFIQKALACRK